MYLQGFVTDKGQHIIILILFVILLDLNDVCKRARVHLTSPVLGSLKILYQSYAAAYSCLPIKENIFFDRYSAIITMECPGNCSGVTNSIWGDTQSHSERHKTSFWPLIYIALESGRPDVWNVLHNMGYKLSLG